MRPTREARILALASPWSNYDGHSHACTFCGKEECICWGRTWSPRITKICKLRREALRLTRGLPQRDGTPIEE